MINTDTIKNLDKKYFFEYLKSSGYNDPASITRGKNNKDYSNLVQFLETELNKSNSSITHDSLDNQLYTYLYFNINNHHTLFNLTSFVSNFNDEIEYSTIEKIIHNPDLKLNNNIATYYPHKKYDLCSTRIQTKTVEYETNGELRTKEVITQIQFLFYIDTVTVKSKGRINLFCNVEINLDTQFVSFKCNENYIKAYEYKHEVIDTLTKRLCNQNDIFKDFKLNYISHNETTIRKGIQKLFIELSEQAEKLLHKEVNSNADKKIKSFLKEMGMPDNIDYKKQIISVVYQHISRRFENNLALFKHGWAFRFLFKEGDNTRASSSHDKFMPVYSKQVYWNLKELMFKKDNTDFIEAGLTWNTMENGQSPVSVRLTQKSNYLTVYYYTSRKHNFINRKEKEKYVLQKIREGFPRK